MSDLIDSASAILRSSERRLEAAANNVANTSTAGYKRHIDFSEAIDAADVQSNGAVKTHILNDFSQGQLSFTEQPLDLALMGSGFLKLRAGDEMVFTRGGSFSVQEDGLLADAQGRILQQAGGGDLRVGDGELTFLEDGTVLENGLPTSALAMWEISYADAVKALGGSLYAIDDAGLVEAQATQLRQGFLEDSNVVMSDEMVSMMAAIRQAEGGGRIVQFYDQMMGQAVQTFSGGGQ